MYFLRYTSCTIDERSGHIEILITMKKANGKSIEVFFDIAYIIINLPSSIVTELAQIKNSSSNHFLLEEDSENEIALALAAQLFLWWDDCQPLKNDFFMLL